MFFSVESVTFCHVNECEFEVQGPICGRAFVIKTESTVEFQPYHFSYPVAKERVCPAGIWSQSQRFLVHREFFFPCHRRLTRVANTWYWRQVKWWEYLSEFTPVIQTEYCIQLNLVLLLAASTNICFLIQTTHPYIYYFKRKSRDTNRIEKSFQKLAAKVFFKIPAVCLF